MGGMSSMDDSFLVFEQETGSFVKFSFVFDQKSSKRSILYI